MTNTNNLILDLINKNASVNEITNITGLSHKQLFHRMNMLKIKGYDFKKKYYYNGDITYKLIKGITEEEIGKTLLTSKKNTLKIIMFSDLHIGNINERPDLLYAVYEKCIKDDIHIIINAGDLIDGPKTCGNYHDKKILDIEKQVERMLKNYPFDKNIINFICLGNHDYASLKESGLDLDKILDNKRHDLVSLGYGFGCLNVKNDQIIVRHPTEINKIDNLNKKLIIVGHSHRARNVISPDNTMLYLPSLSDMKYHDGTGEHHQFPSFIIANLNFNNGIINTGDFEHYIFVSNEIYKVSESRYDLSIGKKLGEKEIKNIEIKEPLKKNDIKEILLKNNIEIQNDEKLL